MNENELMHAIQETAEEAKHHRCYGNAPYRGTPPKDYLPRAAALLKTYGYRLIRTDNLVQFPHGRTRGEAVGLITDRPQYRNTVLLAKGMHPVEEFTVLCHEMAHVILGHPVQTPQEYRQQIYERAPYMQRGLPENPRQEMSCELAAAAVCKALGVPTTGEHVCYLSQRLQTYRYPINDEVTWAAHLAARKITEVMS